MNIPPIIGLAGRKKSGKDYAYQVIKALYPTVTFVRVSFADSVKEEVAKATNQHIDKIEEQKDKFRLILQWWGTDFRRNMFDKDYWIKKWLSKVSYIREKHPDYIIVATDVRFQNELDAIHIAGGKVCLVYNCKLEQFDDTHESEKLGLFNIDYSLHNDMTPMFISMLDELTKKEWK